MAVTALNPAGAPPNPFQSQFGDRHGVVRLGWCQDIPHSVRTVRMCQTPHFGAGSIAVLKPHRHHRMVSVHFRATSIQPFRQSGFSKSVHSWATFGLPLRLTGQGPPITPRHDFVQQSRSHRSNPYNFLKNDPVFQRDMPLTAVAMLLRYVTSDGHRFHHGCFRYHPIFAFTMFVSASSQTVNPMAVREWPPDSKEGGLPLCRSSAPPPFIYKGCGGVADFSFAGHSSSSKFRIQKRLHPPPSTVGGIFRWCDGKTRISPPWRRWRRCPGAHG